MRFGADFGPKFSKLFRDRKIFAFEIARDRAEIRAARAERLTDRPRSVNCPQTDAAREIGCDSRRISNRNFRKFSAATTFGARNRAEIRCAPRAAAWLRSLEVLRHCAECWHAAAREIRCDCRRISNRNFRKIFAAANFCIRNRARSRRNPCRSVTHSLATSRRGPQAWC